MRGGANEAADARKFTSAIPPGSVIITDVAAGSINAQIGYVYTPPVQGIDACAAIVKHEFRHKWQFEQSWGITNWSDHAELERQIGRNGAWILDGAVFDKDRDFIKDSWESRPASVGGWGQPELDGTNIPKDQWPSYAYFLNKQLDGNTFQPDAEFDADINGARTWVIGSLDSQDWAKRGKQSNPPF